VREVPLESGWGRRGWGKATVGAVTVDRPTPKRDRERGRCFALFGYGEG